MEKKKESDRLCPTYRPICILDEAGKLLERIITSRMRDHLMSVGDLSDAEFGFHEGRSTCDAVLLLQRSIMESNNKGWTTVAVSLDIKNTFNSLSWASIHCAMRDWNFPLYLRRIICNYLKDRRLTYVDRDGNACWSEVSRGVPQGSVLGPLLWRGPRHLRFYLKSGAPPLPPGCRTISFADDTLVLAEARLPDEASQLATDAVAVVVEAIKSVGLEISAAKTEVIGYRKIIYDRCIKRRPVVDGSPITLRYQMRYLGFHLDSKWLWCVHFQNAAKKANAIAGALTRVLPNLNDPRESTRHLYMNIIHSVLLYGSSVWAEVLERKTSVRMALMKVQRRMALRVISAYKTISYAAAGLLAQVPSIDLLTSKYSSLYHRVREVRSRGITISEQGYRAMTDQADEVLLEAWTKRMEDRSLPSVRVREALVSRLDR